MKDSAPDLPPAPRRRRCRGSGRWGSRGDVPGPTLGTNRLTVSRDGAGSGCGIGTHGSSRHRRGYERPPWWHRGSSERSPRPPPPLTPVQPPPSCPVAIPGVSASGAWPGSPPARQPTRGSGCQQRGDPTGTQEPKRPAGWWPLGSAPEGGKGSMAGREEAHAAFGRAVNLPSPFPSAVLIR